MLRTRYLSLLVAGASLFALTARATSFPAIPDLSGGASSIESLADSLLVALAANDEEGLQKLRVSESEYLEIIVPGTVPVDSPRRKTEPEASAFFWRMLDAKSRDFSRLLLAEFGGKRLTRHAIRFTKGTNAFAAYTAHGQLRILVTDASGAEHVVRSGTVAQVGDRYKLIGLNWDD